MTAVQLSLDTAVYNKFKAYVLNKHGQLYGRLGKELDLAMVEYMRSPARKKAASVCVSKNKTATQRRAMDILSDLSYGGAFSFDFLPAHLEESIIEVVSADPRIIKKYTDQLIRQKYLLYYRDEGTLKLKLNPDKEYDFRVFDFT